MLGQEEGVDYRPFLPDKRIANTHRGKVEEGEGYSDIEAISGKEESHKK